MAVNGSSQSGISSRGTGTRRAHRIAGTGRLGNRSASRLLRTGPRRNRFSQRYPEAILAVGGLPWIIPCVPDRPALAKAVRATFKATAPARDLFELELLEGVFQQRKPLPTICRRHQMLNVA